MHLEVPIPTKYTVIITIIHKETDFPKTISPISLNSRGEGTSSTLGSSFDNRSCLSDYSVSIEDFYFWKSCGFYNLIWVALAITSTMYSAQMKEMNPTKRNQTVDKIKPAW